MTGASVAADMITAVAIGAAGYETVALATRRTPPITTLCVHWRRRHSPLLLVVFAAWLGLGWHLFVQKAGA